MVRAIFLCLFITVAGICSAQNPPDKAKLLEFYQTQKYAEAAAYLVSLHPAPADASALSQIGYFYLMAGNLQEAENYYLAANQAEPESMPILFNLAKINVRRGNNALARSFFERTLAKDSSNFNVYKQLAQLINAPSEDSIKLKYLVKANTLNPKDAEVADDLGNIYFEKQKPLLAYRILNIAIAADTANLVLLKSKLPVCYALKKQEELILTGEKLLANGEKTAYILNQIGKACVALKQYQKALSMYLAIDPTQLTESTFYYTSICYKALKNYPEAIKYANKTINESISPNVANYYAYLGALNESNGQVKTAAAAYKRGLLFDDHEKIYYNLGLLYDQKLNDKKLALANYKKYLASNIDKKENIEEITYVKARVEELQK